MVMRKLFLELWRDICRTRTRYLSILMIVALGVGFFVGIKVCCPNMLNTANNYFREANLADFRLMCNYGLTEADVEATAALDGIRQVEPGYSVDVFVGTGSSLDVTAKALSFGENDINRLTLLEGRFPSQANECVVEQTAKTPDSFVIGETIRFSVPADEELSDTLHYDTYTIVGIIESPNYIGLERGNTSIGDGSIDTILYIREDAFALDVYTDLYVTLTQTQHLDAHSEAYDAIIDKYIDFFDTFGAERASLRHDDILSEANEELEEARKELADGEAEAEKELSDAHRELLDAEQEIADAEQEIADAEQEIADAEIEIADGWEELRREKAKAEAEIADAEVEIADGEQKLADAQKELADGWEDYRRGNREFDIEIAAAQEELDDAKKQIESGFLELNSAKATLDASKAELNNGRMQLQAAQDALNTQKNDAYNQIEGYRQQILEGVAAQKELIEKNDALSAIEKEYALQMLDQQKESQLSLLEQQKTHADAEFAAYQAQIDEQRIKLESGAEKLADGLRQYEEGYQELLAAEQAYEEGYEKFLQERSDAEHELLKARRELENAEETIRENIQTLEDAKEELADARITLAREIADAEKSCRTVKRNCGTEKSSWRMRKLSLLMRKSNWLTAGWNMKTANAKQKKRFSTPSANSAMQKMTSEILRKAHFTFLPAMTIPATSILIRMRNALTT